MPKRCHHCKSEDHLISDCPTMSAKPEADTPAAEGGRGQKKPRAKRGTPKKLDKDMAKLELN